MLALLTDFHTSDDLGVVKGVMKSINPTSELLDLYNYVAPFQIKSGAWLLLKDYKYFPRETVFYCVVDPGVGSGRKAVAVKTTNYYFVGPDNGLMYPAANDDKIEKIVELPIPQDASKTFHGRDVFAPAAAKLDKGDDLISLGNELSHLQQLNVSSTNENGEIVAIEHYGNIITNLSSAGKENYEIACNNFKKHLKFYSTFSEAEENELFVIKGSSDTLEIAVNQGSAVDIIGCKVGDRMSIR